MFQQEKIKYFIPLIFKYHANGIPLFYTLKNKTIFFKLENSTATQFWDDLAYQAHQSTNQYTYYDPIKIHGNISYNEKNASDDELEIMVIRCNVKMAEYAGKEFRRIEKIKNNISFKWMPYFKLKSTLEIGNNYNSVLVHGMEKFIFEFIDNWLSDVRKQKVQNFTKVIRSLFFTTSLTFETSIDHLKEDDSTETFTVHINGREQYNMISAILKAVNSYKFIPSEINQLTSNIVTSIHASDFGSTINNQFLEQLNTQIINRELPITEEEFTNLVSASDYEHLDAVDPKLIFQELMKKFA